MEKIGKGINFKNVGIALGCMAFSGFLFYMGLVHEYTISIKRFTLPQWSIYVLGGIAALIGIALFLTSLRNKKCLDCGKILQEGNVELPLDKKDAVLEAVNTLNAELLKGLPVQDGGSDSIIMNLNFCPKCTSVAEVDVISRKDWDDTVLIPVKEISGNGVEALVKYVEEFGEVEED